MATELGSFGGADRHRAAYGKGVSVPAPQLRAGVWACARPGLAEGAAGGLHGRLGPARCLMSVKQPVPVSPARARPPGASFTSCSFCSHPGRQGPGRPGTQGTDVPPCVRGQPCVTPPPSPLRPGDLSLQDRVSEAQALPWCHLQPRPRNPAARGGQSPAGSSHWGSPGRGLRAGDLQAWKRRRDPRLSS